MPSLFYDARWEGAFGIGRYSLELRRRLGPSVVDLFAQHDPLSPQGLASWESLSLRTKPQRNDVLLSPSFTPSMAWRGQQAITVHDLIHLDVPSESSGAKQVYYRHVVRPLIRRSPVTFTVSQYSKARIIEWSGVEQERVIVTGNAADATFRPEGDKLTPGYPYILYVRNSKPHKNTVGLIEAFASLREHPDLHLILSGNADEASVQTARALGVEARVIFAGRIPEADLPSYYRGARVVAFPSFYEGFGIPAVEGMACGVPVVASTATSLPEILGNAALFADPHDTDALADALSQAVTDETLRARLIQAGLDRSRDFTWDNVARRVAIGLSVLGWALPADAH